MEGSGLESQQSRKTSGMGGTSPSSYSSLAELFDGWRSQSSGGLVGYGRNPAKAGIFPSKVMGRESNKHELIGTQRGTIDGHSVWSSAQNVNANNSHKGLDPEGKSQHLSGTFLGSSLYYGGRDLCCELSTSKTEGLHWLKKDNLEDDTDTSNLTGASRGNWWQGSLYY